MRTISKIAAAIAFSLGNADVMIEYNQSGEIANFSFETRFSSAMAYSQSECDWNNTCDPGQYPIERIPVGPPGYYPPLPPYDPNPPIVDGPPENGSGGGGGETPGAPAQSIFEPETVGDHITNLWSLKNNLNRLLMQQGLSPEARALIANDINKLSNALNKANILLNVINSGVQGGVHLAEGEYGKALSEVAALAAALGVGVLVTGPITGIAASFAAAFITEMAIDYMVDRYNANYSIDMYNHRTEEDFWNEFGCVISHSVCVTIP